MATNLSLSLSLSLGLVAALTGSARADEPQKLVIGIYAPSVEFGTAQARLAYLQGLAKAIESRQNFRCISKCEQRASEPKHQRRVSRMDAA